MGKNAGTYAGKLADNTVDNGYIVTFIQSGINNRNRNNINVGNIDMAFNQI